MLLPRARTYTCLGRIFLMRRMATSQSPIKPSIPHIERTKEDLRDDTLHPVILHKITQINNAIRIVKLKPLDKKRQIPFQPGQWVDLHIPGLESPGGFTLTSCPPSHASPSSADSLPASVNLEPEDGQDLELAVQKSINPPVVWLWQKQEEILGTELAVRVGGSFVWPPRVRDIGDRKINDEVGVQSEEDALKGLRKVVFVAGGVGINPFISMLRFLDAQLSSLKGDKERRNGIEGREGGKDLDLDTLEVGLLYGFKALSREEDPKGEVLFWKELNRIFARQRDRRRKWKGIGFVSGKFDGGFKMGSNPKVEKGQAESLELEGMGSEGLLLKHRRIERNDIESILDAKEDRKGTVVYVCGPRTMTDEFVEMISMMEGMSKSRVLCERWW
ncbi:hypothetical protein ACMFMG_010248 [Clarireedia jacksonii]